MNPKMRFGAPARTFFRAAMLVAFGCQATGAWADDYFSIFGIMDHDQRRDDLPGDGGMYCVPTSTYNLINFMGKHGLPGMLKHPSDPNNVILNSNPYDGHTLRIASLGAFMNTDPNNGTNGNGWTNGFINYVNYVTNVPLILFCYNLDEDFPSPGVMLAWMRLGGLVSFCYGRYSNPYGYTKTRKGGHCVTLNSVNLKQTAIPGAEYVPWMPQTIDNYDIGYRDPAQDEGADDPNRLFAQSPFTTVLRDLHAEKANFGGTETVLYGIGSKPEDSTKNYAYIDGIRVIHPLFCLTNVLNSDNFQLHFSLQYDAQTNWWSKLLGTQNAFGAFDKGDLTPDPIAPAFVRTMPETNVIVQSEYLGRTSRNLAVAPFKPIGLEYQPNSLNLFALQGSQISKLDRKGKWQIHKPFDFTAEAFAFDPSHGRLAVAGHGNLNFYDYNLNLLDSLKFTQLNGDGRLFIRFDPSSGDLFTMRRGLPAVQRFANSSRGFKWASQATLQDARDPLSFDIGPGGFFFVSDGGVMRQYGRSGALANSSIFNGAPCGEILRFGRTFNNWDAERYPNPAWRDLAEPGLTRR